MQGPDEHIELPHSPYKSPRDAFLTLAMIGSDARPNASTPRGQLKERTGIEPPASSANPRNRRSNFEDENSPSNGKEFYFCFKLNTFDSEDEEMFIHTKKEGIVSSAEQVEVPNLQPRNIPSLTSQPRLDNSAAKHRIALKKQKCSVSVELTSSEASLAVQPSNSFHHVGQSCPLHRLVKTCNVQAERHSSYQEKREQKKDKGGADPLKFQRENAFSAALQPSVRPAKDVVTETDIDSVLNEAQHGNDDSHEISLCSIPVSRQEIKSESTRSPQQMIFAHFNLPQFSSTDKMRNVLHRHCQLPTESDARQNERVKASSGLHQSSSQNVQSIPNYQPHHRQNISNFSHPLPHPSNSNPNISLTQQHSDRTSECDIWQRKPPGGNLPLKKRAIPVGARTNPLHSELIKEVSSTFKHNVAASSCSLDELEMSRNESSQAEFINHQQYPFALIHPSRLVKGSTKRSLTCVANKPKSAVCNEEEGSELAQMFDKFRRRKMQSEEEEGEGRDSCLSDSMASSEENKFISEKTISQPILNSNDALESKRCLNNDSNANFRSKHLSFVGDTQRNYDVLAASNSFKEPSEEETKIEITKNPSQIEESRNYSVFGTSQIELPKIAKESKTLPRQRTSKCSSSDHHHHHHHHHLHHQSSTILSLEMRLNRPEGEVERAGVSQVAHRNHNQHQTFQCSNFQDPENHFNRSRSFSEESHVRDSLKVKEFSLENDPKVYKSQSIVTQTPLQHQQRSTFNRQTSFGSQAKQLNISSNACRTTDAITYCKQQQQQQQQRHHQHQQQQQQRQHSFVASQHVNTFPSKSYFQPNQAIKETSKDSTRVCYASCRDRQSYPSNVPSIYMIQPKDAGNSIRNKYRPTHTASPRLSSSPRSSPPSIIFTQQLLPTTAPRKRDFPQPVQQEPAWFALARRKSKEWSEKQIL